MEDQVKYMSNLTKRVQKKFGGSVSVQLDLWKHPDSTLDLTYSLWIGQERNFAVKANTFKAFKTKVAELMRGGEI